MIYQNPDGGTIYLGPTTAVVHRSLKAVDLYVRPHSQGDHILMIRHGNGRKDVLQCPASFLRQYVEQYKLYPEPWLEEAVSRSGIHGFAIL